jgi:DNA-binding GntR family transcriptional regulator
VESNFATKKKIKDAAYEAIKEFIFNHDGEEQVYSERQLAGFLKVGLAPVRAALAKLRAEGMIVVAPNVGISLPALTAETIVDFYEIRIVLESWVVERLAGQPLGDRADRIEDLLTAQADCVRRGDAWEYHRLDMIFHLALAEMAGNREMLRVLESLRDRMFRVSSRAHASHPERLSANYATHLAIFEAIKVRDGLMARECLRAHLSAGRAFLLDPAGRTIADEHRRGNVP